MITVYKQDFFFTTRHYLVVKLFSLLELIVSVQSAITNNKKNALLLHGGGCWMNLLLQWCASTVHIDIFLGRLFISIVGMMMITKK